MGGGEGVRETEKEYKEEEDMESLLTLSSIDRICRFSISASSFAAAFFRSSLQSGLRMIRSSCSMMNSVENFDSAEGEVSGSEVLFVDAGGATMSVSEVLIFMFVHNLRIRLPKGYI